MNHQWQPISEIMYDQTERTESSNPIVGGGTTEFTEDELIQAIFNAGLFTEKASFNMFETPKNCRQVRQEFDYCPTGCVEFMLGCPQKEDDFAECIDMAECNK